MFFWKTADSYWLTHAQAFRWMQFSVVTWRRPLDEEVVGAEELEDDSAPVSNESSLDTRNLDGRQFYILQVKVTDILRLFNSLAWRIAVFFD